MKRLWAGLILSVALAACSDSSTTGTQAQKVTGDIAAGKAFADRECKGCHGLDGKGVAPGIPHLAGQSARYLLSSLKEYKDKKRTHAALRDIAAQMSEADATITINDWIVSYKNLQAELNNLKAGAEQKARATADQSAHNLSCAAIWSFFALLIGLLAAALGGRCGASWALRHANMLRSPAQRQ